MFAAARAKGTHHARRAHHLAKPNITHKVHITFEGNITFRGVEHIVQKNPLLVNKRGFFDGAADRT